MTAKIAILETSVGVHFSGDLPQRETGDIGLVSILILTDEIAPSLFWRTRGRGVEEVVIIDYRVEAIFIALSGFRAF